MRTDLLFAVAVMPPYHRGLLDVLAEESARIEVVTGDVYFTPAMVTEITSPLITKQDHNVLLLGRRLLWQRGGLRPALAARVTVVEINPRTLLGWVVLAARRVLGRRTIGWGHAHPRRGASSRTTVLRRAMQWACDELVTYTVTERDQLRAAFPAKIITAAPNSLYRAAQMYREPCDDPVDVILIGRLVEDKRPLLAVEAFALAAPELPAGSRLRIIGDGPLRERARARAEELGIAERVTFEGWIDDVDRLRGLFSRAMVMLSAGYVGLNVTQALGFGTPVVYPDDEPHAPEIESLDDGNSESFRAGDAASCAEVLVRWGRKRHDPARRARILQDARADYSIEAMAVPFQMLARHRTTRPPQVAATPDTTPEALPEATEH